MKILFVTSDNYPFDGACSNILLNILSCDCLNNDSNEVAVLTTKKKIDDLDEEIFGSVKIFRILSWNLVRTCELKKCLRLGLLHQLIRGVICKSIYCLKNKFLLGDSCFDYSTSKDFFYALEKITEKFDVIISISGKYESSIALNKLYKKKHCKFILYQVDPFSTNKTYAKLTRKKREKIEFSIYKNASAIITTPIIAQEHHDDTFSCFSNKIYPMEFPVVKPRVYYKTQNTPIRCIFLGSFYGNIRKPDYTIELFRKMVCDGSVTLEFVGNIDDNLKKYQDYLPIKCWGRKSISECQEIMQQADVLINIGNTMDNQVPSKIFDYISTGKPIVNVCKIKKCPTLPYLSKYKSSLSLFEDELLLESQKKQLNDFLSSLPNVISNQEIFENYHRCTPEYVANRLIDILKNI